MRQAREGESIQFLVTANAGFRKQALMNVQGFDERISIAGGEDYELSYRIRKEGSAIAFVADAVVKHEHHQRLSALHKMNMQKREEEEEALRRLQSDADQRGAEYGTGAEGPAAGRTWIIR